MPPEPEEIEMCSLRGRCLRGDRWHCESSADWCDADGVPAWGGDGPGDALRYLATMTAEEGIELADVAAGALDSGWWQGFNSANGGWLDGEPWDEREAAWRVAAADFMARYEAGERVLTEGMIQHAMWDLARELAFARRWCPFSPHPKC
jgi:hypothetical protein